MLWFGDKDLLKSKCLSGVIVEKYHNAPNRKMSGSKNGVCGGKA